MQAAACAKAERARNAASSATVFGVSKSLCAAMQSFHKRHARGSCCRGRNLKLPDSRVVSVKRNKALSGRCGHSRDSPQDSVKMGTPGMLFGMWALQEYCAGFSAGSIVTTSTGPTPKKLAGRACPRTFEPRCSSLAAHRHTFAVA